MSRIRLEEHFTYSKLIRFVLPTVAVTVITSIYTLIDGIIISNYAGELAFEVSNFVYPFLFVIGSFGYLFGVGGSSLITATLGRKEKEHADRIFSMLIWLMVALGIAFIILGQIFMVPIFRLFKAEGELLEASVEYGRLLLLFVPCNMLQYAFPSLFVADERQDLSILFTIAGGITNLVFDLLFIARLNMGYIGSAWATALAQIVAGIGPLLYFLFSKRSNLKMVRTSFVIEDIKGAIRNGMSEFLGDISYSAMCMAYDFQLMKMMGNQGISIYGVISYVNYVINGVFLGYASGIGPVIGYHYGADNKKELDSLLKKSMKIIFAATIAMYLLALAVSKPFSAMFVGYNDQLLRECVEAMEIDSFSYLPIGFNFFIDAYMAAQGEGKYTSILSFMRTVVFKIGFIFVLPIFMGKAGVWLASPASEFCAFALAALFLNSFMKKRKAKG